MRRRRQAQVRRLGRSGLHPGLVMGGAARHEQPSGPSLASAPSTHQSLCFGVTSSSVALKLLLRVGGRDCKTSGQSQPGTGSPQRLRLFHPNLSTPSHPPRCGTSKRDGSCYRLSSLWAPHPALRSTAPPTQPPSSPCPCSPVSSSRKARQRLASRGSRTQGPAPAAHSSRRLCPARPSSMCRRSCRGTARASCSQLAGGPLWRRRGQSSRKE